MSLAKNLQMTTCKQSATEKLKNSKTYTEESMFCLLMTYSSWAEKTERRKNFSIPLMSYIKPINKL